MINIELLREKRDIEEYFESLYDFIYENFEEEDQKTLDLFVDKILEEDSLDIYQKMQAISNGVEKSVQEFGGGNYRRGGSGSTSPTGGGSMWSKTKNKKRSMFSKIQAKR